jgi:hypothetical protein
LAAERRKQAYLEKQRLRVQDYQQKRGHEEQEKRLKERKQQERDQQAR